MYGSRLMTGGNIESASRCRVTVNQSTENFFRNRDRKKKTKAIFGWTLRVNGELVGAGVACSHTAGRARRI